MPLESSNSKIITPQCIWCGSQQLILILQPETCVFPGKIASLGKFSVLIIKFVLNSIISPWDGLVLNAHYFDWAAIFTIPFLQPNLI